MKEQTLNLTVAVSLAMATIGNHQAQINTSADHLSKQKQGRGIYFTENKGQIHDQNSTPRHDVLYGVMTGNMSVHIKSKGVSYQLYRADTYKQTENPLTKQRRQEIAQQSIYRIDLNWLHYNSNFTKKEDSTLPGFTNYYLEACASGAVQVKTFTGITLKDLYKGIHLHYYEKNGELKHDYIVSPHADYKKIQLQVEGAIVSIHKDGSLILSTPFGQVQEGTPIVYQAGKSLKAKWLAVDNVLSFEIENYDSGLELIIDPVTRLWGTYYGGPTDDEGYSCTTDAVGNVYLSGFTDAASSTLIATNGSHQSTYGGGSLSDAFLAKFTPTGVRQWATYYGGNQDDRASFCAVDASGNVYLTGSSMTNIFNSIATNGSHQSGSGGGYDAFLVKFNSSGIRQWGTYYGDMGTDAGLCCTIDASGNIYMAGYSSSNSSTGTSIATNGSHQPTQGSNNGYDDAFLAKFNSNGVRQWATYYGGSLMDVGSSCSTDAAGNVYLSGYTASGGGTIIATTGSHQSGFAGIADAFLVKFNSSGVRQWGTYYGGQAGENGAAYCTTDVFGNVFLTGYTASGTGTVIASSNSHQSTYGGGLTDAFLVKFNSSGSRLWATYYGGSGYEEGTSCKTDIAGNLYLPGITSSTKTMAIATPGSHQLSFAGGWSDAFLVKFDQNGVRQSGTYFGGAETDYAYSCTVDFLGRVYIAGVTSSGTSTNIATGNSHQSLYGGDLFDAFLVRFDACEQAPIQPSAIGGATAICSGTIGSYTTSTIFGANSYTWSLPGSIIVTGDTITAMPLVSEVFTLVAGNGCGVSPQQTLNVTVYPKPTIIATSNTSILCAGQSAVLTASGATSYTFDPGGASATVIISPVTTSVFTITAIDANGCSGSTVITQTVEACTGINESGLAGSGIKLYPNPNNGIVNMDLYLDYEVSITNTLNQVVYSCKSSRGNHQINLEYLARGVYLVKINNTVNSTCFKLIKE